MIDMLLTNFMFSNYTITSRYRIYFNKIVITHERNEQLQRCKELIRQPPKNKVKSVVVQGNL